MLKPFLNSVLIWLLPAMMFAQQTPTMDNYEPARSSGALPPDILQTTTEKYERSKQQINTGQSEELQKAEDNFYLQTNYQVDQILHSGTILVGDSMGMYVNRVADSLLANDPVTRAQINIYILRSTVVNAFATDRGSIFITIGLLTRLHNEAELAFVLAHEIVHFKRRHVLTGYIEGVQMQEGEGQYSQTTAENRYLKRHSYARSQETQADEEGFDMLVASNYDPHAAMGAFDILEMAEFPFTDTTFSKSLFEDPHFVFPSKYYADTAKPYKIDEDEEDNQFATHPSVPKRKKSMKKRFAKLAGSDTSGKAFLVSEEMFYRVRAMAMFEEAALHTNDGEFKEAVYINSSIQKTYPGNYYLEKEMVRALYAVTVKKNNGFSFIDLSDLLGGLIFIDRDDDDDDDTPIGQQARAKSFIGKTDQDGWNVAAVKYAWKVHTKFPEDKDITFWTIGLFRELTVENNMTIRDFEDNDSDYVRIGNMVMLDTALSKKLKVDTPQARWQIAIDHLDRDSLGATKYYDFAFVNELKDSAFVRMFKDAMEYADSLDAIDDIEDNMTVKEREKLEKEEDEAFYGPQGLSKIVVVNPIYQSFDSRIDGQLNVKRSIEGRAEMMGAMLESADEVGMKCEFLDPEAMDSTDVEKFNDLMMLNDWFSQKGNFKASDGLPVPQDQMNQIAAKYGTNYFMWCAYYTSREPRSGTVFRALSMAFAPLAPLIAIRLATPREDVYFVAVLYDITTGKAVWGVQREILKQKPTDARLKLQMYDMMLMLGSPKKTN